MTPLHEIIEGSSVSVPFTKAQAGSRETKTLPTLRLAVELQVAEPEEAGQESGTKIITSSWSAPR